jgi:Spy/CpxP family protein refolding chaperone
MRKTWITAGLMLLPTLAQAQPPAPPPPGTFNVPVPPPDLGKWWKNSEIASALGVTSAQVQKIEQIFVDHRLKLIDLNADLQREEARLEPLVEADQPDEAQVSAALDRVTTARGRLEKVNALMMLAIRRVLTVEQWHKLEAIKREREFVFVAKPPLPPGPGFVSEPARPAEPPRPGEGTRRGDGPRRGDVPSPPNPSPNPSPAPR